MKTVLKALLNWADKSGTVKYSDDLAKAVAFDNGEEDIVDATATDVTEINVNSEDMENKQQEETK